MKNPTPIDSEKEQLKHLEEALRSQLSPLVLEQDFFERYALTTENILKLKIIADHWQSQENPVFVYKHVSAFEKAAENIQQCDNQHLNILANILYFYPDIVEDSWELIQSLIECVSHLSSFMPITPLMIASLGSCDQERQKLIVQMLEELQKHSVSDLDIPAVAFTLENDDIESGIALLMSLNKSEVSLNMNDFEMLMLSDEKSAQSALSHYQSLPQSIQQPGTLGILLKVSDLRTQVIIVSTFNAPQQPTVRLNRDQKLLTVLCQAGLMAAKLESLIINQQQPQEICDFFYEQPDCAQSFCKMLEEGVPLDANDLHTWRLFQDHDLQTVSGSFLDLGAMGLPLQGGFLAAYIRGWPYSQHRTKTALILHQHRVPVDVNLFALCCSMNLRSPEWVAEAYHRVAPIPDMPLVRVACLLAAADDNAQTFANQIIDLHEQGELFSQYYDATFIELGIDAIWLAAAWMQLTEQDQQSVLQDFEKAREEAFCAMLADRGLTRDNSQIDVEYFLQQRQDHDGQNKASDLYPALCALSDAYPMTHSHNLHHLSKELFRYCIDARKNAAYFMRAYIELSKRGFIINKTILDHLLNSGQYAEFVALGAFNWCEEMRQTQENIPWHALTICEEVAEYYGLGYKRLEQEASSEYLSSTYQIALIGQQCAQAVPINAAKDIARKILEATDDHHYHLGVACSQLYHSLHNPQNPDENPIALWQIQSLALYRGMIPYEAPLVAERVQKFWCESEILPLIKHNLNLEMLITDYSCKELLKRDNIYTLRKHLLEFHQFCQRHSEFLDCFEQIATNFMRGCVNQPTQGFIEISSWIYAAVQSTPQDILQALKYRYAIEQIMHTSIKHQEGVGREYAVELANLLLAELNDKRMGIGHESWPHIPRKLAYTERLLSYIKDASVQEEISQIAEILDNLTQVDLLDFVLEEARHFHEVWGRVLDNAAMEELIENQGRAQIKALQKLYYFRDQRESELKEFLKSKSVEEQELYEQNKSVIFPPYTNESLNDSLDLGEDLSDIALQEREVSIEGLQDLLNAEFIGDWSESHLDIDHDERECAPEQDSFGQGMIRFEFIESLKDAEKDKRREFLERCTSAERAYCEPELHKDSEELGMMLYQLQCDLNKAVTEFSQQLTQRNYSQVGNTQVVVFSQVKQAHSESGLGPRMP